MITASDVLSIAEHLEAAGVTTWLDGGWGIDALLQEQTRPHDDLDLVMALTDADAATEALAPLGFTLHEDERPTRFILRLTARFGIELPAELAQPTARLPT